MLKTLHTFTLLGIFQFVIAQPVSFTKSTGLFTPNPINFSIKCIADMNNDQLDDLIQVNLFDMDTMYIYYQQSDGSFDHQVFATGVVAHESWDLWSVCVGDMDNNGHNDILFSPSGNANFLMANADGTDYTANEVEGFLASQRSNLSDIDNDGFIDAFICNDNGLSLPYRNDGAGGFTIDQSLIETVNLPGNYASIWTDFDDDRDLDLYISKCYGGTQPGDPERTNALYRNDGNGTFVEVASLFNLDDNAQSWLTMVEDFDNDGDLDMFIVNHSDAHRFYSNNGDGTYTDVIHSSGIPANEVGGYEAWAVDLNNDGLLDIVSDFDDQVYINEGGFIFTTSDNGLDGNCAVGDLNNDGYLDLYEEDFEAWINDGGNNNWVKLNLEGVMSNRSGIGSKVTLRTGNVTQMRELRSGESYASTSSSALHFGLNQAENIDEINIYWPSGIHESFYNIDINAMHTLVEGSGDMVVSTDHPQESVHQLKWTYHSEDRTLSFEGINAKDQWKYTTYGVNGMLLDHGTMTNNIIQMPNNIIAPQVYMIVLEGESQKYIQRIMTH